MVILMLKAGAFCLYSSVGPHQLGNMIERGEDVWRGVRKPFYKLNLNSIWFQSHKGWRDGLGRVMEIA